MTKLQFKIASTWVIEPVTLYMVFCINEQLPIHWIFVLIIGTGICSYLRSSLPGDANNIQLMFNINSYALAIIYFSTLLISAVTLYLMYPDKFLQNTFMSAVIFVLALAPFLPSLLKHERKVFRDAGALNA